MANPSIKFSLSLYMSVDALVDYWRRLEEGVEGSSLVQSFVNLACVHFDYAHLAYVVSCSQTLTGRKSLFNRLVPTPNWVGSKCLHSR